MKREFMTEAVINPRILVWARERQGLSWERVTKSTQTKPGKVRNWEEGVSRPSLRQASKVASALHIPLGYLYLDTPPDDELPLPDLRTVDGGYGQPPSPDFLDTVNNARRKQDWYREYLISEGSEDLPFVGSMNVNEDVDTIAETIADSLGIDDETPRKARNWSEYVTLLTRLAENVGVLVLRNGIVGNNTKRPLEVSEFRGFALVDHLAPLLFINTRDAKSAQVFTLVHELAHIWLGESGVSNIAGEDEPDAEFERTCNAVAAQLLVPEHVLKEAFGRPEKLRTTMGALARRFWVSTVVVLRRCYEVGLISRNVFFEELAYQTSQQRRPTGDRDGGDFSRLLRSRNGGLLTSAVIAGVRDGRVPYREAAAVLDVKPTTVFEYARGHHAVDTYAMMRQLGASFH